MFSGKDRWTASLLIFDVYTEDVVVSFDAKLSRYDIYENFRDSDRNNVDE